MLQSLFSVLQLTHTAKENKLTKSLFSVLQLMHNARKNKVTKSLFSVLQLTHSANKKVTNTFRTGIQNLFRENILTYS
jgi:hypothetical protein